jgi:hypothetical protein
LWQNGTNDIQFILNEAYGAFPSLMTNRGLSIVPASVVTRSTPH